MALAAAGLLAPTSLVSAAPATATTLKVTTTRDELASAHGKCSLREAVEAVDSPGTKTDCGTAGRKLNTILLGPGRYRLSITPSGRDRNASGDLNVTGRAKVRIIGAGRLATVIDASGLGDRVLAVAAGATVTLKRLDITGGHSPGAGAGSAGKGGKSCAAGGAGGAGGNDKRAGGGGGIYNAGTMSLDTAAVTGNTAGAGGSGGAGGASSTSGCGGGAGGQGGDGGGIYNAGRLVVTRSTISENAAGSGGPGGSGGDGAGGTGGNGGQAGNGGGIYSKGNLSLIASTVSENVGGAGGAGGQAGAGAQGHDGTGGLGGSGGGIFSRKRSLHVTNSTIAGNSAGAGGQGGGLAGVGGPGGDGGAVGVMNGASRLLNATVADNAVGDGGAGGSSGGSPGVDGTGGALFVQSLTAADDMRLQNTIVASSVGLACASDRSRGIADRGHDLSYGDTSCPGANGNPMLLALKDNGGPTETMALESGSAAIGGVPTKGAHCPPTDQRGVRRPQDKECDIGSFEFATPRIKFVAPVSGAFYGRQRRVVARYICSEGGIVSPIASCTGSVPAGRAIDTASRGEETFEVTATDTSGNRLTKVIQYTVLPYINPFREVRGLIPGRIDMGVDYGGSGPILALGDGTVKLARDHDRGWPAGGWLMYQLSNGPFAGKYVYVAENITVHVRKGQRIFAGQRIATLHSAYPHLETGWAAGQGDKSLADVDGHRCPCGDPGGWSTIDGRNFDHLLVILGTPSGYLQPDPPDQSMPPGWPRLHEKSATALIPRSLTPLYEGWTAH